ncbi:hypothetical protein BS78_10G060700 [Paspalum vaginatum]|nr:hypothetical protein BS78_10G060700 [Paspalum vaginatum]KAJ1258252.1 hypothetical protein BS78_10G060700 [Paspalum vaginatum]
MVHKSSARRPNREDIGGTWEWAGPPPAARREERGLPEDGIRSYLPVFDYRATNRIKHGKIVGHRWAVLRASRRMRTGLQGSSMDAWWAGGYDRRSGLRAEGLDGGHRRPRDVTMREASTFILLVLDFKNLIPVLR